MHYTDFIKQLKRHEGFRDHVYIDSTGHLTAGWGHAFLVGSPVPQSVCEALLQEDIAAAEAAFASLQLPIDPEDTVRRYALINMLFNLGLSKFKGFKKMLAALQRQEWPTAAKEMLASQWAGQVGYRAKELARMVRTGSYTPLKTSQK